MLVDTGLLQATLSHSLPMAYYVNRPVSTSIYEAACRPSKREFEYKYEYMFCLPVDTGALQNFEICRSYVTHNASKANDKSPNFKKSAISSLFYYNNYFTDAIHMKSLIMCILVVTVQ